MQEFSYKPRETMFSGTVYDVYREGNLWSAGWPERMARAICEEMNGGIDCLKE